MYNKYKVRVSDKMTEGQLFEVLTDMLSELRDGHVNLSYSMDYGRYWAWHEAYPQNYNDTLERRYMGTDYKISAGINYRVLDDNIGYLRYGSFSLPVGEGNLDDVLIYFALCRGLIIDIRNNGGGDLTTAERLAGRFVQEKTLVGYMQHKTGTGHSDFSAMEPCYLEPSSNVRWHKPVCVLTNRSVWCRQRLCRLDGHSAQRHAGGRPYWRRLRTAHVEFAAHRLERAFLSLPHVRRPAPADRVRHPRRRPRCPHRRGYSTRHRPHN